MRKDILLPGAALLGGAAGFFLRRWERATAFEPDSGLVTPGMPATWALITLSLVMALVFLLLCRGEHRTYPGGYDEAFGAKGNTVYITVAVLCAFLLLGSAVLGAMALPGDYSAAVAAARQTRTNPLFSVLPKCLLILMSAASCFSVLSAGRSNYRGESKGKNNFALLMPAYTWCIWLISAYQVRGGDPVRLNYIYEIFAIVCSLLGLYFIAGFSFERAKGFRASFFSLLGVFFSAVTLADGHSPSIMLLFAFNILYLTANMAVLLSSAGRAGRMPQPGGAGQTDLPEETTEVTDDE